MIIYLYVKTHKITGLKYLGKTTSQNPAKYKGSGKYWTNHLRVHGNHTTTEIIKECQTNDEIRIWGEYYSVLWDVVTSTAWANLKPESGDGGGVSGIPRSAETKRKIRDKLQGIPRPPDVKERISAGNLGKTKSKEASSKSAQSRTGLKKSEEFCKNVSARQKGVPKSVQHLQKMRAWRKTDEGKEIMRKAWEKRRAKKNIV
jgi:hypothetical protein